MKSLKYLLIPFLIMCFVLTACKGKDPTPASVDSEKAMDNFLAKISEGNYVLDAEPFMKATVPSKDQVYFEYTDEAYGDFVVMSVNDEVFQAGLKDDGLGEVSFVKEGTALNAASKKLVNYWMDDSVSEGNIYNLFYNIQEEPLKFVSYEAVVKQSLLSFVGYGEMALPKTEEVYLVLDKEDPTVVHLQAVVEDDEVARIFYDDIDITITFGDAKSLDAADEWMKAPTYPEAKTEWTEGDEFVFNSVFLPGFGHGVIPFPAFASYALSVDNENFVMDDEVFIRDSHASEEDVTAYAQTLIQNGYTEVKETAEDGTEETFYRRMLREEYQCYSSIELSYEDGMNLTAKKYYDFPVYDNLDAINAKIAKIGYPALPASENISSFKGTDTANEMIESWLYFFDYDLMLYVDVEYEDYDELMTYLDDYGKALVNAGFHPRYIEDTDEIEMYESANEFCSFRYHVEADGAVTLLFKSERYISADEAAGMISAAGFPAMPLKDPISCRDLRKYEKVQFDKDMDAYITLSVSFDSVEEAGNFFDNYEAALTDAGFGRVSPDTVSTSKPIALYDEVREMLVAAEFFEEEDGAVIYYDFKK